MSETEKQKAYRIQGNRYYQLYLKADNKGDKIHYGLKAINKWMEAGQTLEQALKSIRWSVYKYAVRSGYMEAYNEGQASATSHTYISPKWDNNAVQVWGLSKKIERERIG